MHAYLTMCVFQCTKREVKCVKMNRRHIYGVPGGTKPHNYGYPYMDLHNSMHGLWISIINYGSPQLFMDRHK